MRGPFPPVPPLSLCVCSAAGHNIFPCWANFEQDRSMQALTCVLFCAWSYLKYCLGLFVPCEIHTDRDINSARLLASFVLHCYTVCRPLFTPFRRATPRKLPPIRNRTHNENKDKRRKKKPKKIHHHTQITRAEPQATYTLSLSLVHRDSSPPPMERAPSSRHWKP